MLFSLTYGTASALYLAIRSKKELAHKFKQSYGTEREIAALSDFSLDDIMTGVVSIKKTIKIQT